MVPLRGFRTWTQLYGGKSKEEVGIYCPTEKQQNSLGFFPGPCAFCVTLSIQKPFKGLASFWGPIHPCATQVHSPKTFGESNRWSFGHCWTMGSYDSGSLGLKWLLNHTLPKTLSHFAPKSRLGKLCETTFVVCWGSHSWQKSRNSRLHFKNSTFAQGGPPPVINGDITP